MKKVSKFLKKNLHWLIVGGVALLCALFIIFGHTSENGQYRTLDGNDAQIPEATKEWEKKISQAYIKYAKETIPALLADGTYADVATVESIDDNNPIEDTSTSTEGGRGSYIWAPTDTFDAFKDYTIGKCLNVDGAYGSQCWDLAAVFWMNYTNDGRTPSTCQTGAARGMWDCRDYNAGDEFDLVYDKTDIQTGDWIITSAGTYGHVCEAAGPYNNGYVACLGENQNGSACPGGGAATNIINLGLGSFSGAFRPKTYEKPEPTPTPTPSGDITYSYVPGDYFSGVLTKLGLDEGNLWGESGTVEYYTQQLVEQNVLDRRGNVLLYTPFTLKRRQ